MKKITIVAIIGLAASFASCKKDRTCTCTYNKTWIPSSDTEITTYTNSSKKTALATCSSGTSYDPSEPSKVVVRNCSLK